MPALSLDTSVGFVLSMFWRATAVTYVTHLVCTVVRLRGRCLSHWLQALLLQADPLNFRGRAGVIADAVLRHPMIGAPARRGDAICREQLVLIMLDLADAGRDFSPALQTALSTPATLGRLNLWFDQAMIRATRDYRGRTRIVTRLASLAVLLLTENTTLRTLCFLWIPLSLGSPFWYDLLKRLVPLLRSADVGRVHRRPL
jgi:hypothetical protein